jgi:hypothetical protein
MIKGFMEGLIGMHEGQTKIIGPIPPEDAYGAKFGVGAIFSSNYFAFGMNQTVIVTNYTTATFSAKWINMENLGNFTMPQLIINNLQSSNATEMVIYPPPYYIWENSASIINIADTNVTVRTTPTRSTNLSSVIKDVRDGEKLMLIFPNATTASWDDTTITVVSSPVVGQNYTFQIEGYTGMINITVHINSIIGDIINVTITNDQDPTSTYLDVYRILTFNRSYSLPRIYTDIPSMYMSYLYQKDIEKAGYSFNPLAGETVTFEVTIEKVYKTSRTKSIVTKINEDKAISNDDDTQSIGYSLYVWTFPPNCKICVKQNNQLIEQGHTDDKQIFPFAGFCYWEERFNGTIQVCIENEGLPTYVKNIQMNNDVGFMVFRNLFSIPIPRTFWPK